MWRNGWRLSGVLVLVCSWVLWQERDVKAVGDVADPQRRWSVLGAWPTKMECETMQRRGYANLEGARVVCIPGQR